jgi:acyl-CoA synthetase (AMP-forming)/AMP-acid ligase II
MSIALLLDIAASTEPERVVLGSREDGFSLDTLSKLATGGAGVVRRSGARTVVFLGANSAAFPVAVFAAARAGVPIAPLNYRLSATQLVGLLYQLEGPLVIADRRQRAELANWDGGPVLDSQEWLAQAGAGSVEAADLPLLPAETDGPAVLLFTSGTTSAPKCVVLRHEHLLAYVLETVEPASVAKTDAALVSVPPYHVAGTAAALTNIYAGRRVLYLQQFTPSAWLNLVASEEVTSAMLVPTMLARIIDHLGDTQAAVPSLRSLAYGGARLPQPVLERALRLFPTVDFVNGYGLTETSSTIAVLGPDDHRAAIAADAPAIRARLSSVGRLVSGVEGQIRSPEGAVLWPGDPGELWVRGRQISGEYIETGSTLDADGWFRTKDRAWFDADGYLFVEGRMDDTIIRGGENIAPAEIEDVLLDHPEVREAAVVGQPDEEWGERIAAFIVPTQWPAPDAEQLRDWVRQRLRSSKTPDDIHYRDELPHTDTGKLLRRELTRDLAYPVTGHRPALSKEQL